MLLHKLNINMLIPVRSSPKWSLYDVPIRKYDDLGFLRTRAQKGVAHRQGQADSLKLPSLTLFPIPKWVDSSFQTFWSMEWVREIIQIPDYTAKYHKTYDITSRTLNFKVKH